jgi:hypothetical protein
MPRQLCQIDCDTCSTDMPFAHAKTRAAVGYCLGGLVLACLRLTCWADDLDTMGVTLVRASHPTLTGAGINIAQAEAVSPAGSAAFEVNYSAVGAPQPLFTWISASGASTKFPNSLGTESSHADEVADCFYGSAGGVAPGVAHVDNYEANDFYDSVVETGLPISDGIVNLSFANQVGPPSQQPLDSAYDNYIAENGTLFCSAVNGVGTNVGPPGTAYNCIGVGAYGVGAPIADGPTLDNGRSKPDIVAPGTEISFTTPYVAGAAAVLLQAATAGDGGTNTADAGDARTIKALLLNGALKPSDWTHTTNAPLDTRYGAGVLNLYYSYQQLAGGQQGYTSQNTVSPGAAHPPISSGQAVGSLAGWDFESLAGNPLQDTVSHYLFNVSSNSTLTATLVWERHAEMTNINNLALFLYDATNAALLSCSVSMVDNVQHLYLPCLLPGNYDLEVVTYARSTAETYALAFQFYTMSPPSLSTGFTATSATVTWPGSPTVYALQQTSSLKPPVLWTNVIATEWITNGTVSASFNYSNGATYFRLKR